MNTSPPSFIPSSSAPLDVIIPVYQEPLDCLQQCCHSLWDQNPSLWQAYFVVDQGTHPDLVDWIKHYCELHRQCFLIHSSEPGLASCRKQAFEQSGAPWVLFLDADDQIIPGALEYFYEKIKHSNAPMYIGGLQIWDPEKTPQTRKNICPAPVDYERHLYWKYLHNMGLCFFPVWNRLYRRSFLTENHLVIQDNIPSEDLLMNMLVYDLSPEKILSDPQIFVRYRQHSSSLVHSDWNENQLLHQLKVYLSPQWSWKQNHSLGFLVFLYFNSCLGVLAGKTLEFQASFLSSCYALFSPFMGSKDHMFYIHTYARYNLTFALRWRGFQNKKLSLWMLSFTHLSQKKKTLAILKHPFLWLVLFRKIWIFLFYPSFNQYLEAKEYKKLKI